MAHIRDLDSFLEKYLGYKRGIDNQVYEYYWWNPLDRPILSACQEHPDHSDCSEVYAKVALVNRMYSAQLGRGKVKKFDAEDRVTRALWKSDIDKFLRPFFRFHELSAVSLPKVLKCHDRLVKIVRKGAKNDALSFCSKYLSFHVPEVGPIYDSRAVQTLNEIEGLPSFRGLGGYEKHCRRILCLVDFLKNKKINPKLKIIDYVLYSDC